MGIGALKVDVMAVAVGVGVAVMLGMRVWFGLSVAVVLCGVRLVENDREGRGCLRHWHGRGGFGSAQCASHSCANDDEDDDEAHDKKGAQLHAEDDDGRLASTRRYRFAFERA